MSALGLRLRESGLSLAEMCRLARLAEESGYASREAMEEIREDLGEGADIVMIKPALPYLDVIARARAELDVPIAAYHVSGEYAMVHAAAERGWLDLQTVAFEHTLAIKRAGADLVLTYFAGLLAEGMQ